jgi:hypothetical protein
MQLPRGNAHLRSSLRGLFCDNSQISVVRECLLMALSGRSADRVARSGAALIPTYRDASAVFIAAMFSDRFILSLHQCSRWWRKLIRGARSEKLFAGQNL